MGQIAELIPIFIKFISKFQFQYLLNLSLNFNFKNYATNWIENPKRINRQQLGYMSGTIPVLVHFPGRFVPRTQFVGFGSGG